jgi:hypothetical protein
MPLLNPTKINEKKTVKILQETQLLEDIQRYCKWCAIASLDEFYAQAARFVLAKDKEWVAFQSEQKQPEVIV